LAFVAAVVEVADSSAGAFPRRHCKSAALAEFVTIAQSEIKSANGKMQTCDV
jgi:hypothetical protein